MAVKKATGAVVHKGRVTVAAGPEKRINTTNVHRDLPEHRRVKQYEQLLEELRMLVRVKTLKPGDFVRIGTFKNVKSAGVTARRLRARHPDLTFGYNGTELHAAVSVDDE